MNENVTVSGWWEHLRIDRGAGQTGGFGLAQKNLEAREELGGCKKKYSASGSHLMVRCQGSNSDKCLTNCTIIAPTLDHFFQGIISV